MSLENYELFKSYIKNLGYDIDIESYPKLKDAVEYFTSKNDIKGLEHFMQQCQNCGGYALQIPICIYPPSPDYTFEEKVIRITELFPFVRLLSDSKLNENEYIVIYRAGEEGGHHFIRVDKNGNAINKWESNMPEKFHGWGTLSDSPEAVFAVVEQKYRSKEINKLPQCTRDMFLDQDAYYETEDDYTDIVKKQAIKPITFEDKLKEAYQNKKSSFLYKDKEFYLKINKNDPELIYICNDSEILGDLYTDGNLFMIEYDKNKKNKIYGFKPDNPINVIYEKKDINLER